MIAYWLLLLEWKAPRHSDGVTVLMFDSYEEAMQCGGYYHELRGYTPTVTGPHYRNGV